MGVMEKINEVGSHTKAVPSVLLIAALIVAVATAGLFSAETYTRLASQQLPTVVTDAGVFDIDAAKHWWSQDNRHLDALADRWPFSIPTLVGEIAWLGHMHRQITYTAELMDRGYTVLSPSSAGQAHMLAASLRARVNALAGPWYSQQNEPTWKTYKGQPLAPNPTGIPANVNDVAAILDELDIPDHALADLQITVLPFVLEETAGLGLKGEAIIGAAPVTTSIINRHRTAYTLLHELGHHVHLTYLDDKTHRGLKLWNDYANLRGIPKRAPSNPTDPGAWHHSPEETFAEDFRTLFGPPEARIVPHGTVYGDPNHSDDGGLALRHFMAEVLSN